MARSDPPINIRMPSELKEKIVKAAKDNGRSMNAEIVYQLDQLYGGVGHVAPKSDANNLDSAVYLTQSDNVALSEEEAERMRKIVHEAVDEYIKNHLLKK